MVKKYCECGCGREVKKDKRFFHGHNTRRKEQRVISEKGYVSIIVNNYVVSEHRHIWEKHNGKIPKGYFIHHINGIKHDNRVENLQLVNVKKHGELHSKTNKIKE